MHLLPFLQAGNHLARCFLDRALKQADIPASPFAAIVRSLGPHIILLALLLFKGEDTELKERLSEMLRSSKGVVQLGCLTAGPGVLFTVLILQC